MGPAKVNRLDSVTIGAVALARRKRNSLKIARLEGQVLGCLREHQLVDVNEVYLKAILSSHQGFHGV